MAVHNVYGGTTKDIDDIPMGTHGDIINIWGNSTVIVNQTPKYIPGGMTIYDGTVHINGAGATSPINFWIGTSIDIGTKGNFYVSEGWWTVGTANGSPDFSINLQDYHHKTTTGGSRMLDVKTYVPSLRVEAGRNIGFSGGTTIGTLPQVSDWLYSAQRGGTNIGKILSMGTVPGDSTLGTFVVDTTSGTIQPNEVIQVRKLLDRQGPIFDILWEGTCTTNTLESNIYETWSNTAAGFLTGTSLKYIYRGYTFIDNIFVSPRNSSTGTFGNNIEGKIPYNNARILAPKVKLLSMFNSNINTYQSSLITGTAFRSHNPSGQGLGGSYFFRSLDIDTGVVDINGASFSNQTFFSTIYFRPQDLRLKSVYFASGINYDPKITRDIIKEADDINILIAHPPSDSGSYNVFKPGPNEEIKHFKIQTHELGTAPAVGRAKFIESIFHSIGNVAITGGIKIINSLSYGQLICSSAYNIFIRGLKMVRNLNASYINFIGISGLSNYIAGLENMYQVAPSTSTDIFSLPNVFCGIKIRACGNSKITEPAHVLRGRALYSGATLISGAVIDVARMYTTYPAATTTAAPGSLAGADIEYVVNCSIGTSSSVNADVNMAETLNKKVQGIRASRRNNMQYYTSANKRSVGAVLVNSFVDTFGTNQKGYIDCIMGNDYVLGSGSYNVFASKLYPTSQIEYTQPYFALGHTGFSGEVGVGYETSSAGILNPGQSRWSGGSSIIEFQYDTSGEGGTGFNGTWRDFWNPSLWTGISVDPNIGVKLKYRITNNSSTPTAEMYTIITKTEAPWNAEFDYLYPIDQQETVITLQNMVVGSRYYIYNQSTTNLLTSGVATSSTVTFTTNSINANNNDVLLVRVRYASDTTKYLPFETNSIITDYLSNIWVSQTLDTIA
jgi:hypothetical protein